MKTLGREICVEVIDSINFGATSALAELNAKASRFYSFASIKKVQTRYRCSRKRIDTGIGTRYEKNSFRLKLHNFSIAVLTISTADGLMFGFLCRHMIIKFRVEAPLPRN